MVFLVDEEKKARIWYDKIDNVKSIDEKISVIKEILQSKSHDEIDMLDALDSLPQKDLEQTQKYNEFLEFIMNEYSEVFIENIAWLSRDLIYWYTYTKQKEKIRLIIEFLIKNPKEDPDVILDIIDVLMLNRCSQDVERLIKFYYNLFNGGNKIIPEGLRELAVIASCCILDNYVDLQKKEYKIKEIKNEMEKYELKQKEGYLRRKLNIITDKKEYFHGLSAGEISSIDKYYFTLPFIRFLIKEKNFSPSLSNFIQELIIECFYEKNQHPINFDISKIDEYIASWCGFASIRKTKSFGIICAFILYIEFLLKNKYIDDKKYNGYLCAFNKFASQLSQGFKHENWKYSFVFNLSPGIELCLNTKTSLDYDNNDNDILDNTNSFNDLQYQKKIGRNEPCPCGSGKKYKKCCLEL